MRHHILPQAKALAACEALLDDPSADVDELLEWAGSGVQLDTVPIEDLVEELRAEFVTFVAGPNASDLDEFEGRVGARLHAVLGGIPVPDQVLDHPGFWGYLTVRHFWWLVRWRQASTFETRDYGKYGKYVDGSNPSECVLHRAYVRGRLSRREGAADPYELAYGIGSAADFWRSHVIRVRTGSAPTLTRAFAAEQMANRMGTDELRPYARRLNRMWSNVVLHVLDDGEAAELVAELRDQASG